MSLRTAAVAALLPLIAFAADSWDKDKTQGNPSAPVSIEIYSSFDCPHCRDLHENMLPKMIKDMVGSGRVVIVQREFPLSGEGHKFAREAANLATAAARIGKYNAVAEALFKNQATWATNGKVWDTVAPVLSPAEQAKVKTLAADPSVTGEVDNDARTGAASGIDRTPFLIVTQHKTGKKYPFSGTPQNYDFFRDFVLKDLQ